MGLRGSAETLEVIVVDERDEIAEPDRRRHENSFPGRPFLQFAVAKDHVDDSVPAMAVLRETHPDSQGQAVAERSGRRLDAGIAIVGMHAKLSATCTISVERSGAEHA